jgi:hypothetical protein
MGAYTSAGRGGAIRDIASLLRHAVSHERLIDGEIVEPLLWRDLSPDQKLALYHIASRALDAARLALQPV